MATRNFGKFKIKTSEDGIAFRFGDGKIHRLGLGRKGKQGASEYDDYNEEEYMNEDAYSDFNEFDESEYVPGESYAPGGYSGRFAQPDDGGEFDDYADDYDDRYDDDYDDRYDDGGYADEYGDDYGDDGYYDGDGYADDEGMYDDRYLDEDAEDYGDAPYASENPVIRYVDENDWVTYVLLVLLPPLGIYLLWRRRRFDMPIRWGISAVSAVWFIIMIVLLISLIFSGSGDTTTTPPIEMVTPTATIAAEATIEPDPLAADLTLDSLGGLTGDDGITPAQTQDVLAIGATATPIAGANIGAGTSTGNTVIMTATGLYYHNNSACENIEENASISNVTTDVAVNRGKTACPICYPNQSTYYATANGSYYHKEATCSNMENASIITKEAATKQGKTECPVCIKGEINSLDNSALKFATASTTDKSNITVYATAGGRYFHVDATCGGMTEPASGSLLKAMLAGKKACPTCCAAADNLVWCTEGGRKYHNKSDCSGMENAYKVTLAEALILGKDKCGDCWGQSAIGSNVPTGSGTAPAAPATGGTIYVFGTKNGKYYHTNSSCSGMTGASRYTLKSMISSGKTACPTCCSGAETVVYATDNGAYYHSFATCSGMQNAKSGTLAQALAYGKSKCPNCWAGSDSGASAILGETASGSYVYCTQNGTYYHVKSSCSGMTGASKVQISTAVTAGKKACPTCAPAANYKVYSTQNGSYYHRTSSCSGMEGAVQRTIEEAVVLGQAACPVCITSYLKANSSSGGLSNVSSKTFSRSAASSKTYKSGKSGIKVYATSTSNHYHTTSSCSGMKNASRVTLETALNYGKTACSKCASSANTTVYAVKNGKYYHYSKNCAGSGAVKGKRAYALALGLDACPYCVTKTKSVTTSWKPESGKFTKATVGAIADAFSDIASGSFSGSSASVLTGLSSGTFKAGTSGLKVYASVGGKYYHANKSCAGSSASRITLETALNYGKKACPSCASSASKKVYSSKGDKYYHTSKAHAGSGAVSGSFAQALASGKKECPSCIGGSEAYEVSDIKYAAAGDTAVYIDVNASTLYYHKSSYCGDANLSGGTKVMLDFVIDWGFKACPFCNPPTSVK